MGLTITITAEVRVDDFYIKADHMLTDTEIDYAAFDVVCHTVNNLRKEVCEERQRYLDNLNG